MSIFFKLCLLTVPILPNLWCIWHASHHDFADAKERNLWIRIGVFVPVLGGLAYFFIGRRRARPMQQ